MSDIEKTTEYFSWISDLKKRYHVTQIKAAIAVNTALLEFYWNLGKDISEKYALEASYGSSFFKKLSADLKIAIPDASGLSARNLKYCQDFFCLYASKAILPQVVAKLAKGTSNQSQSVVHNEGGNLYRPQVVDDNKVDQQIVDSKHIASYQQQVATEKMRGQLVTDLSSCISFQSTFLIINSLYI